MTAYQAIAGTDLPNDFTSADGRKDTLKYDTNGNTMSVTTSGTAGGTRKYTYNKDTPTCGGFEGQRYTAKGAGGKVTSFAYVAKGNLQKVTPPAPLGKTEYTCDALGRVETVTDGRGIKTAYVYDNRDRVTKMSSTNATVTYPSPLGGLRPPHFNTRSLDAYLPLGVRHPRRPWTHHPQQEIRARRHKPAQRFRQANAAAGESTVRTGPLIVGVFLIIIGVLAATGVVGVE